MVVKPRIDFFFDVVSPYSWIAHEGITRYAAIWPIELRYKPFNFGAVVKQNPGAPLRNELKKWYLYYDVPRMAKYWHFEIKFPKDHEKIVFTKSSAPPMRLLNAFLDKDPERLSPVARALWKRFYVEGKGFFEDHELMETMRDLGIENPEMFLEHSKSEKVKQMLRDHTKEAIDSKAFGAPWFNVHIPTGVEHFFGSDSLPLIAHTLKLPYTGSIKP